MKKIKNIILAITVCLVAVACGSNTSDLVGGGSSLSVKIDGTSFKALGLTTSGAVTNGVLVVQGGKANGETVRITITNYTGKGTYKTGDNISNTNSLSYITLTPTANWTSTFNIGSGTVNVTKDTGSELEGTFNFVGLNGNSSKNFTEGKFAIDY